MIAKRPRELAAYGIEPRHLRAFQTAADREVGLVEQVVSPLRRSREAGAEARAEEAIDAARGALVRLHAAAGQGRTAPAALSRLRLTLGCDARE